MHFQYHQLEVTISNIELDANSIRKINCNITLIENKTIFWSMKMVPLSFKDFSQVLVQDPSQVLCHQLQVLAYLIFHADCGGDSVRRQS